MRSERELEDIVASPYSKKIVENILSSGHRAALEFDFFIFGLEGYSRGDQLDAQALWPPTLSSPAGQNWAENAGIQWCIRAMRRNLPRR